MKDTVLTLTQRRRLTPDTYALTLSGDTGGTRPGQFVNILLPGYFLRRPISVACDTPEGLLLLVRTVGGGTRALAQAPLKSEFQVLTGLGNGFTMEVSEAPVLVGGGVGIAPLYGLARAFLARGTVPSVILGFRTAADAFFLDAFAALECPLTVATEDGSLGVHGRVTDCPLPDGCFLYACGPTPMLRALSALDGPSGGEYSLEARMGCGFGACVGCTVQTKEGPKRVCADGPVFRREVLLW